MNDAGVAVDARERLLLLGDPRLPVGSHVFGAGAEAAVAGGSVRSLRELTAFLRDRLVEQGLAAATAAAAACLLAHRRGSEESWDRLDAMVDAALPSAADGAASRAQGRAVVRFGVVWLPSPVWPSLGSAPHHAVALGVATEAGDGTPQEAALLCLRAGAEGPAVAALRRLGDGRPDDVMAALAPAFDVVAARAVQAAVAGQERRLRAEVTTRAEVTVRSGGEQPPPGSAEDAGISRWAALLH